MLIHNFKYTFKTLMRQRMLIFWTFAFPLMLGFFFNMAFSNIEKAENFDVIDVAIVDNDAYRNDVFMVNAMETLSDKDGENYMFDIKYVTEDKAKDLLGKNKIAGYLVCGADGGNHKVVIAKNGTDQTIFKSAVDTVAQNSAIIETKIRNSMSEEMLGVMTGAVPADDETMQIVSSAVMNIVQSIYADQTVNIKNVSGENLSYTVIEFYTLIAMTCLYGGIIGMTAINQNLANMSKNGRRTAMSPAKKSSIVLSSLMAGYLIQLIGIALLFLFSIFILKVDFGSDLVYIIPLSAAGCLAGLTMGIAAGVLVKAGEGAKIGIILGATMLFCFLSGMMGVTMKYVIDKNAPIVNKINPAAMITDGLYSLYYYDTHERFFFNIISLLIFSGVMMILSWSGLRRQQYDSI